MQAVSERERSDMMMLLVHGFNRMIEVHGPWVGGETRALEQRVTDAFDRLFLLLPAKHGEAAEQETPAAGKAAEPKKVKRENNMSPEFRAAASARMKAMRARMEAEKRSVREDAAPAESAFAVDTANGTTETLNKVEQTLSSPWSPGQVVQFALRRKASDLTDTMAGDAKVLAVVLEFGLA